MSLKLKSITTPLCIRVLDESFCIWGWSHHQSPSVRPVQPPRFLHQIESMMPSTLSDTTTALAELLFQIERERIKRSLGPLVMLRNYEGLPNYKPGNDIDVIVRKSELYGWKETFTDAAGALGIEVIETLKDYYFISYVFSKGSEQIVKIDLNFAFIWRGVKFAEIETLLAQSGVYVPPIHVATHACERAFVTFCHSFLYGGFINAKYLDEFAEQLREGPEFGDRLTQLFGSRNAKILADRIISGHLDLPRKKANSMRLIALARAAARSPIKTATGLVQSLPGPVSGAL